MPCSSKVSAVAFMSSLMNGLREKLRSILKTATGTFWPREPLKVVKMLPNESTAGLVTGCMLSATSIPMSQAQDSLACRPLAITSSPAAAPSGTRAMTKESEPMMTGAPTSPMVTLGRSSCAKPFPRICNSPPAIAAGGGSRGMRGSAPRHDVVGVDAEPGGEGLQLPHGRRFPDIEESEEGERRQVALPVQCDRAGQGDPLAEDFVHDDDLRVFEVFHAGGHRGGPGGGDEEHGREDEEVPPSEAGVLVKQNPNGQGGQRAGGARRHGGIAAAAPGGELQGEDLAFHWGVQKSPSFARIDRLKPAPPRGQARRPVLLIFFLRVRGGGTGDHVFAGSPVSQVGDAAALAAKRKIGIARGDCFLTNRASHHTATRGEILMNAEAAGGGAGSVGASSVPTTS